MIRKSVVIVTVLLAASFCTADIKLACLFTDHMVLQQSSVPAIWGTADPGEKVTVTGSWKLSDCKSTATDSNGNWMVKLPTPKAGGPYTVTVKGKNEIKLNDVMIGEVWLCSGQSNMVLQLSKTKNGELAAKDSSNYPGIRLFEVGYQVAPEPRSQCKGGWKLSSPDSTADFSAVGYYFGRDLYKNLNVPVGLICASVGASPAESWTKMSYLQGNADMTPLLDRWKTHNENVTKDKQIYEERLKPWQEKVKKAAAEGKALPSKPVMPFQLKPWCHPSSLYNGMIAPIVPYDIRGVIWYQGESNRPWADEYTSLFATLIKNWRDVFGNDNLPFYFVQIAPFKPAGYPDDLQVAQIRQAQLETMKSVPNTGMVVITDLVDDIKHIHPVAKQPVGERLALWALANTYGKDVIYSGPIYKSMKIEAGKIRIFFDYVNGGLIVKGNELTHFEIAGSDMQFYPAKAVIDGNTVVVYSEKVKDPKEVRFGFNDIAEPNLFNHSGLPASPFTTEQWRKTFKTKPIS